MSTREETIALVAQAIDDNGAANTNLQQAKQWLEEEVARATESGVGDVGLLQAAYVTADDAGSTVSTAGVALEAFKEALEALA